MSSQITTPLATYKILNAIDAVKTVTENVMDYYVEMISIVSDKDVISYKYKVYVNYINGIKIVGDLCTYDAEKKTYGDIITGEQIPGVILSHGKLYDTNGAPYYANLRDGNSPGDGILLTSDFSEKFCVFCNIRTYNPNIYDIQSFYYDTTTKEVTKTETFIPTNPDNCYTVGAYIMCLYKDDKGTVKNGVFYLDYTPLAVTNKQLCYRITPKTNTSEGEQETVDPEPET